MAPRSRIPLVLGAGMAVETACASRIACYRRGENPSPVGNPIIRASLLAKEEAKDV